MWPPEGDSALVREGTDVVWATLAWFGYEMEGMDSSSRAGPGTSLDSEAKTGKLPPFRGLLWVTTGEDVAEVSGRIGLGSSQFSVLSCL